MTAVVTGKTFSLRSRRVVGEGVGRNTGRGTRRVGWNGGSKPGQPGGRRTDGWSREIQLDEGLLTGNHFFFSLDNSPTLHDTSRQSECRITSIGNVLNKLISITAHQNIFSNNSQRAQIMEKNLF